MSLLLPSSGTLSTWPRMHCRHLFFFADIFFKDGTNEGLGTGILELFIKSYVLIEVGGENKFGVQCFISAGCQTLRAVYSGSSCSEVL